MRALRIESSVFPPDQTVLYGEVMDKRCGLVRLAWTFVGSSLEGKGFCDRTDRALDNLQI